MKVVQSVIYTANTPHGTFLIKRQKNKHTAPTIPVWSPTTVLG